MLHEAKWSTILHITEQIYFKVQIKCKAAYDFDILSNIDIFLFSNRFFASFQKGGSHDDHPIAVKIIVAM